MTAEPNARIIKIVSFSYTSFLNFVINNKRNINFNLLVKLKFKKTKTLWGLLGSEKNNFKTYIQN